MNSLTGGRERGCALSAFSRNAELLARSGELHPYREGPLGVIEPGAYADIIIVNGDALKDISLLADPESNFKVIMKDGRAYKNTLQYSINRFEKE